MSSASNVRMVTLRTRLDQLGFNQKFGPDSADLVEKLLRSFVKLSEVGSY